MSRRLHLAVVGSHLTSVHSKKLCSTAHKIQCPDRSRNMHITTNKVCYYARTSNNENTIIIGSAKVWSSKDYYCKLA